MCSTIYTDKAKTEEKKVLRVREILNGKVRAMHNKFLPFKIKGFK